MELSILQQQNQVLCQDMIHYFQVLQMGEVQLESYLQRFSVENPFGEWSGYSLVQNMDKSDISSMYENIADTKQFHNTLKDYLRFQLQGMPLQKKQVSIVKYIIECLDEKGYLKISDEELSRDLNASPALVRNCIALLQRLEPPGVGARNLSECLLLQMKRLRVENTVAEAIIKQGLETLAAGNLRKLAKSIHASLEEVLNAKAFIRTLNPKPGNGFDTEGNKDMQYIVPELLVYTEAGSYSVMLNEKFRKHIFVHNEYANALRNCKDKELQSYLAEQYHKAKQIERYIEQRQNTVLSCAREAVSLQKDFFDSGNKASLRTLRPSDAAKKLKIHVSTVYRAICNKHFQCEWGVFELATLFEKQSGKVTEGNGLQSRSLVCSRIKSIIDAENKKSPVSDEMLHQKLLVEGIDVSRRTIAKYRNQLGIPNAYFRLEK